MGVGQLKKENKVSVVVHPAEFFKQQVSQALQNQKVKADQDTEFYIVNLLSRFMVAENLFTQDQDGTRQEEVLALRLTEALSTADETLRCQNLKRLGDVSLYTAGFFSDSLSRKVVDVDYYIGMGRTAYGSLATSGFEVIFAKVFNELSSQFHRFVDVLAEVSELTGSKDPKNILRLYELWLKTRSERAEKSLKEAGIIPNAGVKREIQ